MRSKYRKKATGQTAWGWMTYLFSHRRYMIDHCQLSAVKPVLYITLPRVQAIGLRLLPAVAVHAILRLLQKEQRYFTSTAKKDKTKNRAKRRLTTFQMVQMNLRRITLSALSQSHQPR